MTVDCLWGHQEVQEHKVLQKEESVFAESSFQFPPQFLVNKHLGIVIEGIDLVSDCRLFMGPSGSLRTQLQNEESVFAEYSASPPI